MRRQDLNLDALFGSLGGYPSGYSSGGTSSGYSSYGASSGYSSSYDDLDLLGSLLGSFLGGSSTGGLSGMSSDNLSFLFGRSMSTEDTVQYLVSCDVDVIGTDDPTLINAALDRADYSGGLPRFFHIAMNLIADMAR